MFSQLLARVRSTPFEEHVSIEGWSLAQTSDQKRDQDDDRRGKEGCWGITFLSDTLYLLSLQEILGKLLNSSKWCDFLNLFLYRIWQSLWRREYVIFARCLSKSKLIRAHDNRDDCCTEKVTFVFVRHLPPPSQTHFRLQECGKDTKKSGSPNAGTLFSPGRALKCVVYPQLYWSIAQV